MTKFFVIFTGLCLAPVAAFYGAQCWPHVQPTAENMIHTARADFTGPPPQTILTVGSWSATLQNGVYSETGTSGQNQVALAVAANSKHFTLAFSGHTLSPAPGVAIPVQVSFDSGASYQFDGTETSRPGGAPPQLQADLPDEQVAAWTHDLTADQTMTVTLPGSFENSWVFDLNGTTPTVTAMAAAITQAGITGLPAPWVPTKSETPASVLNENSLATDSADNEKTNVNSDNTPGNVIPDSVASGIGLQVSDWKAFWISVDSNGGLCVPEVIFFLKNQGPDINFINVSIQFLDEDDKTVFSTGENIVESIPSGFSQGVKVDADQGFPDLNPNTCLIGHPVPSLTAVVKIDSVQGNHPIPNTVIAQGIVEQVVYQADQRAFYPFPSQN